MPAQRHWRGGVTMGGAWRVAGYVRRWRRLQHGGQAIQAAWRTRALLFSLV